MSKSSIDRGHSPAIQTAQHGESEDDGAQPPRVGAEAKNKPAPQMNYPIGQDLFRSGSASQQHLPANPEEPKAAEPAYPEPQADELLPPSDFKPFFTLVSDPETGEHHHPTVHYLFSDDDQEILTSAALDALESGNADLDADTHERYGEEEDAVEERVVIIDVAADGKTVTNVASLSKDWQALKTEVGAAPSMGDATEEGGERGLMLKISGTEAGDLRPRRGARDEGLESLVADFGEVLVGLDEVVGKTESFGQAERVGTEEEQREGEGEASLT